MKRTLLLPLLLAGCTTVGPDYRQPVTSVPDQYLESAASGQADLTGWWRRFDDAQLAALVEQALKQNLDIELAGARIREARAQEGVAGAGSSPQVAAEYEPLLSDYRSYLEHNEFELAMDMLEEPGDLTQCSGGYWRNLERAAETMELLHRIPCFWQKFEQAGGCE